MRAKLIILIVATVAVLAYGFAAERDDDRVGGGILLAVFGAALVAVCLFVPQLQPHRERDSSTRGL